MAKTSKQQDSVGWREGYRTGLNKGYKSGVKDALRCAQQLLDYNGVSLADGEFFAEFDLMIEEGDIKVPDEK